MRSPSLLEVITEIISCPLGWVMPGVCQLKLSLSWVLCGRPGQRGERLQVGACREGAKGRDKVG